jgi:hypothetical protein
MFVVYNYCIKLLLRRWAGNQRQQPTQRHHVGVHCGCHWLWGQCGKQAVSSGVKAGAGELSALLLLGWAKAQQDKSSTLQIQIGESKSRVHHWKKELTLYQISHEILHAQLKIHIQDGLQAKFFFLMSMYSMLPNICTCRMTALLATQML